MRKKRQVLRYIADPAEARRKVQPNARIEENLVVHLHFSGHRPPKAGDHIKERSFPCAGRTENAGDGAVEGGVDLQGKAGQREPNLSKAQVHRRCLRMEIIWPHKTVTKTTAIETSNSGQAAASWPSWKC